MRENTTTALMALRRRTRLAYADRPPCTVTDPALPDLADAVWRPLTPDDAEALAGLTARIHAAERLTDPAGPDLIRWFLGLPSIDLGEGTIGAFDSSGTVLADAQVLVRGEGEHRRAVLFVQADPAHLEAEAPLLAWAETRARRMLGDGPVDGDRALRVIAEEHRHRWRRVVQDAGFEPVRSFVTMRRSLTGGLPPIPPTPAGIQIVPWSDDVDPAVRRTSNASFSDHWGAASMTWEEWRAHYADDEEGFLPEHSYVALAGGEAAAFVLGERDPEADERHGHREFWVGRLGTLAAWRRMGLGAALLARALHSAADAGFDRAALSVDESSRTNATALYDRAGFEITDREIHHTKS